VKEDVSRGIELPDQPSEVHVVKVTGTVDATTVRHLRKKLLAAVFASTEAVVVDLREADLTDSSGVGALARFRWEVVKSGRVVVFVFPDGDVDATGTSAQMDLARRAATQT
jgi:anti-anti-sigma factor